MILDGSSIINENSTNSSWEPDQQKACEEFYGKQQLKDECNPPGGCNGIKKIVHYLKNQNK